MHDSNSLFVALQPPAGGLRRLQRTLARSHTVAVKRRFRLVSGGAFAVSLLVLASLLPGTIARQQQTEALRSAMLTAVAPPPDGIRITDGAAIELGNGNPGVRLYLVQSVPAFAHSGSVGKEP